MSTSSVRNSDVTSLDAILTAMYDVISGPAGQPRDWDRFRFLYHPEARLMPVVSGENPAVRLLSVENYIRRVEPIFAVEDFWERETGREVKEFGRVGHVLSHYESLRDPQGTPFDRGSNSVQLFYDGVRWWIVNVMWNTARAA